ncbi:MAG: hypothetical protein IPM82_16335 [Saprospiraceae bacterium]|nr:hypothetical protein [Saprospiraceae bacterium]
MDSAEISAINHEVTFPDSPESAFLLGIVQQQKGNLEAAKLHFRKMESLLPAFDNEKKNYLVFYYKTIAAIQMGSPDSLAGRLEQWRKEAAGDPAFFIEVAGAFGICKNVPTALDWLELAFKNGWQPAYFNAHDTFRNMDFVEVRKSKRFKKLVRKYFPDKVKNF